MAEADCAQAGVAEMKRRLRQAARVVLDSKAGRYLKSLVSDSGPARRKGIKLNGSRRFADVIAYFGDSPDKMYQLEQWLPAFEELSQSRPVVVVTRNAESFSLVTQVTHLPVVLAETQPDLIDLYADADYKLAIYVNNSMRNFQSMAEPSIIHVHVDHGESDKTSSISNQLKAYDKVLVAGQAAKDRCLAALWGLNPGNLVSIGRPPLDGDFASVLPPDERLTVLYAPTWQGENEANNFTSLDLLGPDIIRGLLGAGVRVIYRPHPRMAEMGTSEVLRADESIRRMLKDANAENAGHVVSIDHALFDLFKDVDVLITDVSSVGLDFLYLHTDRGLILTDRHGDTERMQKSSPIGAELAVVSAGTIHDLPKQLGIARSDESALAARLKLKALYFGELEEGRSTTAFIQAIGEAIDERSEAREAIADR
ncbi:CDP-glycerol glycerophosphotransferase family protein [Brevibacterium aurantiacum]|uniref:CDP-glycerol--glycerophosphate glycerophosphotransferase n=1 Tax=Brevibacterium aurantiacum TaxID=273384 RepID=A0A556C445_BREAU|nr:CDP-glycerol glycerophosphotransferase family protein [Brevibacterium aurantiacum]TSI12235.1 CDP-glycerol--glycerophosphate glycerophosphotransferase [Brevibacterium aurantiacum]